jgi:hypothetical protein
VAKCCDRSGIGVVPRRFEGVALDRCATEGFPS